MRRMLLPLLLMTLVAGMMVAGAARVACLANNWPTRGGVHPPDAALVNDSLQSVGIDKWGRRRLPSHR